MAMKWTCPICGDEFDSRRDREDHKTKKHA